MIYSSETLLFFELSRQNSNTIECVAIFRSVSFLDELLPSFSVEIQVRTLTMREQLQSPAFIKMSNQREKVNSHLDILPPFD